MVLSAFGGSRVQHHGHVTIDLEIESGEFIRNLDFLVTKSDSAPLIGNNSLLSRGGGVLHIDTSRDKVVIHGTEMDLFYSETGKSSFVQRLQVAQCSKSQRMVVIEQIDLAPHTETHVMVRTKLPPSTSNMLTEEQAACRFVNGVRHYLPIGKGLYGASQFGAFTVRVLNNSSVSVRLAAGSKLGSIVPVNGGDMESSSISAVKSIPPSKERVDQLLSEMDVGDISDCQKTRLRQIVEKYQNTILLKDELPGVALVETFKVYPKENCPVASQSYRTPYALRPAMKSILNKQLENGLIERTHSAWNSPTLLVEKPNGDHRLVIDYRRVNLAIKGDSYPLPRIPDLLVNLKGSKFFSALDLCSGYHQIPLSEESRDILVMGNEFGQFAWRVMPQGISNAPPFFQRVMDTVFENVPQSSIVVYLDDVLCHGRTIDENLNQLDDCFGLLGKHNLQVKATKAKVLHSEITFCGHKIRDGQILIPEKGVSAVMGIPTPRTKNDAQKAYGLLNYLRKSIPNFAKISRPITKTFCAGKFVWTEKADDALNQLKSAVVNATQGLTIPDVNSDVFVVETDASDTSMAGVLYVCSQSCSRPDKAGPDWHDHNEECLKPVEFFSANFTEGQIKKLFIRDKELMAFQRALEYWRMYLVARRFVWRTDNSNLSYANEVKRTSPKVAKILADLSEFTYLIQRRSTSQMKVSDTLSRSVQVHQLKLTMQDFKQLQQMDPVLNKIMNYVSINRWPNEVSNAEVLFWKKKSSFLELGRQGELVLLSKSDRLLIVPIGERTELLKRYHDLAGHPGVKNTFVPLSKHFTWFDMKSDVESYVKSCEECQKSKPNLHVKKPPLFKTDTPTQIFEKISCDLIGPLPRTNRNNKYIIVCNDHFSKRMHTRALTEKTASRTLTALKQIIYQEMGRMPRNVLTDNGLEFSGCFAQWLQDQGIKHSHSAPYAPTTNGLTERSNATLKSRLKPKCNPNWDELLLPITMQINLAPNEVTKISPIELEFGLQGINPSVHVDVVAKNLDNLYELREIVRKSIEAEKKSRVAKSDRHFVPFEEGSLVLMKSPPSSNQKFMGPFKIVKTFAGGRSYEICNDEGHTFTRQCKDLKPFVEREEVEDQIVHEEIPVLASEKESETSFCFDDIVLYPNGGLGWPLVSLGSIPKPSVERSPSNSSQTVLESENVSPEEPPVLEDVSSLVIEDALEDIEDHSVVEEVVPEELPVISGISPLEQSDTTIDTTNGAMDEEAIEAGAAALARATIEAAMDDSAASTIEDVSEDTIVDMEVSEVALVNSPKDTTMMVEPLPDGDTTMVEPLPEDEDVTSTESELETVVPSASRKRVRSVSQSPPHPPPSPKRPSVAANEITDCGNSYLEYTVYELSPESIRNLLRTREDYCAESCIPISNINGGKSFCLRDQSYLQLATLALRWKCPLKHYDLNNLVNLRRRLSTFCKNSERCTFTEVNGKVYFLYR